MTTEDLHKMIVAYMNRVKYMGLEEIIIELPEWLGKLKQARKELKL